MTISAPESLAKSRACDSLDAQPEFSVHLSVAFQWHFSRREIKIIALRIGDKE
jgi:hypothetical protein